MIDGADLIDRKGFIKTMHDKLVIYHVAEKEHEHGKYPLRMCDASQVEYLLQTVPTVDVECARQLNAAITALRNAAIRNQDCAGCLNAPPEEACAPSDFDCESCKADCVCRQCKHCELWTWKGASETIGSRSAEKLEQRQTANIYSPIVRRVIEIKETKEGAEHA